MTRSKRVVWMIAALCALTMCWTAEARTNSKAKASKTTKSATTSVAKKKPATKPQAAPSKSKTASTKPQATPSAEAARAIPLAESNISYICVDVESGAVLAEQNPDAVRPPASMIKLALMLMTVEGLDQGKWTLDRVISVSKHAQDMGGSQVALKAGEEFPLSHLMEAVAVASANDAAMAVAEGLWGSEDAYKQAMNERMQALGMTHTVFRSVHGLPPVRGQLPDETTARDMSMLARECLKHPQILKWTSIKQLQFRPEEAIHPNTNKLLWNMPDCDGLKTGFTAAAGFCVSATAKRNEVRLLSVVMGSPSKYGRFNLAEELIDQGLAKVERKRLFAAGDEIPQDVAIANFEGEKGKLSCVEDVWFCTTKDNWSKVQYQISAAKPLRAPVKAGDRVASLEISLDGKVVAQAPLTVKNDLPGAGWHWQLLHSNDPAPGAASQPAE